MRTIWKSLMATAAVLAFVACEQRGQRDQPAEETGERSERMEERTVQPGDTAETAERPGERAAQTEGIEYEITSVDQQQRQITLNRTVREGQEATEMQPQAGRELTISFDELAGYMEGEEDPQKIVGDLPVGTTVKVFMDEIGRIQKVEK